MFPYPISSSLIYNGSIQVEIILNGELALLKLCYIIVMKLLMNYIIFMSGHLTSESFTHISLNFTSTRVVAVLLLLAVALLCVYELCAVYVTAGSAIAYQQLP